MNTNTDLKALWNQQEITAMPNMKELLKQATSYKNKTLFKSVLVNIIAALTIAYLMFTVLNSQTVLVTTKIGALLVVMGLVAYLVVSNSTLPMLFRNDTTTSSAEYLSSLIQIKQKQDFLYKTILNMYFVLLSVGTMLGMIEYTKVMQLGWVVLSYALAIGWILFAWFFFRPREIKNRVTKLNEIITKFQEVNKQFASKE